MPKFIELTTISGEKVLLDAERIKRIHQCNSTTAVYLEGEEEYSIFAEQYHEVKNTLKWIAPLVDKPRGGPYEH